MSLMPAVRASLAAVEVAAPVVAPTFVPEPLNAPQVTAGPYLAAVRDLGSPALTLPELERAPAGTRSHSDQVLEQAERLAPVPVARAIACSRPCARGSSVLACRQAASCWYTPRQARPPRSRCGASRRHSGRRSDSSPAAQAMRSAFQPTAHPDSSGTLTCP